jgi:O-antigen/teichoic acid export membrane protein
MSATPGQGGVATARRVVRNTGLQAVADAAGKLATLAFFGVIARELGAEGLGAFSFGIAVVVFIELAGIGLDITVASEVARDRARARDVLANSTVAKLVTGSLGAIVVAAITILGGYDTEIAAMLALVALGKFAEMAAFGVHATFRGLEDAAPIAMSITIQRFSTAIAGSVGLIAYDFGIVAVGAVYLGGSVLGLLWAFRVLAKRIDLRGPVVSVEASRVLFVRSIPIGIGSIFGALLARVDTVILSLMTSAAVVGAYGGAYRLLEGVQFVPYAFGVALLPTLVRLGAEGAGGTDRVVELGLKVIMLVLAPVGLALVLFAEPIVRAFLGGDLEAAVTPARILGGAVAAYGVFIISVYVLVARDRQRPIPWLMAAVAALNVGLNLVLIPPYEATGAAIAMTASQGVATAGMLIYAIRAIGGISLPRAFLSPFAGMAAMFVVGVGVDEDGVGLLLALAAFTVVAATVELTFFRRDLRFAVQVLRPRGVA